MGKYSEQELKDGLRVLQYEIGMLNWANDAMVELERKGKKDSPQCTAYLESFLVHARLLIEFLLGASTMQKKDLVPTDFLKEEWKPPEGTDITFLHNQRDDAHKRLAHMSSRRVKEEKKAWNCQKITSEVNALFHQFMDALPNEPWSAEILSKRQNFAFSSGGLVGATSSSDVVSTWEPTHFPLKGGKIDF